MKNYNQPIIAINIKNGDIIKYKSLKALNFNKQEEMKVRESCRELVHSYKGYFWCLENEYNKDIYNIRLKLNKIPRNHRKYNPIDIKEKLCKHCGEIKSIFEFHKEKSSFADRRSECKKCQHTRLNNKKKTNHILRLKCNLRKRLNSALKVKKWNKDSHFLDYIGCSQEELKIYIENQFKSGMNWENYNIKTWHIDHIIPLSSARTPEEMYKLCHFSNLQPLFIEEHLIKTINELRKVG